MRKILLASAATLLACGTAFAQPAKEVAAPGTIVVHLNGYFQFSVSDFGGNGMSGGTIAAGTAYKNNSVGTAGDVRLYPGFDGQTVNGIWYGAQVEIRTTTSSAGKGVGNSSTVASTPYAGEGNLYVRRAYGYIGEPTAGFVRFGQTDGAFGLLQQGVVEAFGDGSQFNIDGGPYNLISTYAPSNFVYADQGALYTTDKVVYLSPSISDNSLGGAFSFGASYEPNSNGIKEGLASVDSSTGEANDAVYGGSGTRRKNAVDGMVGYSVKLDGFATKISAGYLYAAPLGILGANPTAAKYGYDNLAVYQAGAQTTYMGLTVGANVKGGQTEDGYALKPAGARDALTYIVGASYVNGPFTVGASYFNGQSSGAYVPGGKGIARTLSEYGVAAGANYALAKPLNLWVQYLYGNKHQPGATSNFGADGNAHVQAVSIGSTIKW